MLDQARLTQVADKLVGQVLALKPGETVCIIRDNDLPSASLSEAVSEAAIRVGAEPVSVIIVPRSVGGQELPDTVAGAFLRSNAVVNLARWAVEHTRAATAALQAGVRFSNLRNWEDGVLESPGVTTDYEVVRRNALAVDALLEKGREVRVTSPEGTDFTLKLCGRPGKAQTGFADEPGRFSGLPDGESTVAPLEGSTNGRIVNPYIMEKIGLVTEPFELEIKDGWIVGLKGGKQARDLQEFLEKSDPNAKRIASQFAMGMNPDCRVFPNTREVSKKLGTIHVAMGDNISLGGTVQSGVHIDIVVLNATVTLDGKVILEKGQLHL
ncbi:MAG: aminopeptidase [Sphingomonadaceae bacterium]